MNSKKNSKKTVKRPSLRGKGDYEPSISSIIKPLDRLEAKIDHLEKKLVHQPLSKANAASTIGRTLGNFVGQGDLGSLAGSTLAKYFGHGDYHISSNSLMKGDSKQMSQAKFSSERRGTRITEREFLGDLKAGALVSGATAFDIKGYNLNPTDTQTFPWLSNIANLYDQWEPHGIVFEFVSTSSEYNGSSQALGAVIAATDYDPYDPPFTDKQSMENADYSCSTKPAQGLLHGIECDSRERPTPILYTSTTNGAPATATTLGEFYIATQGCSVANVTLGELWISYDITFYKKQLEVLATVPFITSSGTCLATAGQFSSPTVTNSRGITITQVIGTGSRINFNNFKTGAKYIVSFVLATQNTLDIITNWTVFNCSSVYRAVQGSGTQGLVCYIITTTGPSATLTSSLKISGNSYWEIYVSQIPSETSYFGA